MATFRKFDNQQVYRIPTVSVTPLVVGDVVSYNPSNRELTKVTSKANAIELFADQKELFIVAQSDAITYNMGTPYKSKKLAEEVNGEIAAANLIKVDVEGVPTDARIIAAYRIDTLANVEGLED